MTQLGSGLGLLGSAVAPWSGHRGSCPCGPAVPPLSQGLAPDLDAGAHAGNGLDQCSVEALSPARLGG